MTIVSKGSAFLFISYFLYAVQTVRSLRQISASHKRKSLNAVSKAPMYHL